MQCLEVCLFTFGFKKMTNELFSINCQFSEMCILWSFFVQDEDQEEETELLYSSGQQQQQRLLNLHHYVGHSLIKHQPHTTTPPPTFRPLSRTQPHPAAFQQKNHKQGQPKPQTESEQSEFMSQGRHEKSPKLLTLDLS